VARRQDANVNKKSVVTTLALLIIVGAVGFVVGQRWNAPVTTPTTSTSTTTTVASNVQPTSAIWPFASTSTRFGDPSLAAQTFATDYLGFTNPIVGAFQRGDARSGEIEVRADASGTATTVLLRQLTTSDSWWVIGAVSSQLDITVPSALAHVTSPVMLRGRSTAFEAVVNVEVRQDGTLLPLARTTVHGGSMGVMGPFSASVMFAAPTAIGGAVVLRVFSAKDGHVVDASALRVSFTH